MFPLFVAIALSATFEPPARLLTETEDESDLFIACKPVQFKIDPFQLLSARAKPRQRIALKRFECDNKSFSIDIESDERERPERAKISVNKEVSAHMEMKGRIEFEDQPNANMHWKYSQNGLSPQDWRFFDPSVKIGILFMSIYAPKSDVDFPTSDGRKVFQQRFTETLSSGEFADFEVRNSDGSVIATTVKFLLAAQSDTIRGHINFGKENANFIIVDDVNPEIVKAAVRFASLGPDASEDTDSEFNLMEALKFANFWGMPAYEEFLINQVYDGSQERAVELLDLLSTASAIKVSKPLFQNIVHTACGTSVTNEVVLYLLKKSPALVELYCSAESESC